MLLEVGYDRLSIESVATRGGVGKATIYRRWPDKPALVAAAVEHRAAATPPTAWSGELREDLLTALEWLATSIAGQEGRLLGAVFAGTRSDPALAARMRRVLRRDEAAMTEEPFARAVENGERLVPAATRLFGEVAPAVIVHRLIVVGEPCDRGFVEHLVDDILLPLLRQH